MDSQLDLPEVTKFEHTALGEIYVVGPVVVSQVRPESHQGDRFLVEGSYHLTQVAQVVLIVIDVNQLTD